MGYYFSYRTPIGDIMVCYDDIGVNRVILPTDEMEYLSGLKYKENDFLKKYFNDYFNGIEPKRVKINVKITEFQKKVYGVLLSSKAGDILTYGQIANMIGCSSPRAIGQALKRNPVPIVIPCHRVVGKGWEGGFGGETSGSKMELKRFLLKLEEGFIKK